MSADGIVVDSFVVGPFQENTYLVHRANCPDALWIDPGEEAARLIAHLGRSQLNPVAILNTHAHLDHVGAVSELRDRFGIPFYLHPEDLPTLHQAPEAARLYGVRVPALPEVDFPLHHGQVLELAGLALEVRFTPGHTPGHVCFVVEDLVFSGDALFQNSIGRTDLPGGNTEALLASIGRELLTLDDSTRVYSGHGPATTIGRERRHNPFLAGGAWR